MPDIIIVGYGRSQTYQIKCLRCGKQFFPGEHIEFFCDVCLEKDFDVNEYITESNYSPVGCVGNVVGWENRVSCGTARSRHNYRKVYERDGHICQYCGYNPRKYIDFIPLWIDHVIPHSYGGGHKMSNLVVSCQECNQIASNKVFNTFENKKIYILQKRIEKGLYTNQYLIDSYELKVAK